MPLADDVNHAAYAGDVRTLEIHVDATRSWRSIRSRQVRRRRSGRLPITWGRSATACLETRLTAGKSSSTGSTTASGRSSRGRPRRRLTRLSRWAWASTSATPAGRWNPARGVRITGPDSRPSGPGVAGRERLGKSEPLDDRRIRPRPRRH